MLGECFFLLCVYNDPGGEVVADEKGVFRGDDDYFSSDLSDERVAAIWGRMKQPVLIVPSGEEEYVPKSVDVDGLVSRWKSFCPPGIASELSGLIPGANHRVDNAEGQAWLAERVSGFLAGLP